ncbi:guanine-N(7)--methyltransferase subunit TRM82 [Suhomyces tanzawaensis NRRL Y-17324]|uniref:Guanine-N(7)--methyltransferase subunit TRM82 n=1 Tax=Suhomyces tanzawaensis NRRL Y-17324 TaxID=984487 RepID=A0A1E4SJN8_9ASCO|nr:guanine-N(7)--methyltransferase subunit TRM82 [Suhomyces tanzawaensis NRRL Y-17324]ODV79721.1 guanine-N(7)--methyltransferase subunit TRM82 [Suhomyces tanzawaensis NRRL Y-17324]
MKHPFQLLLANSKGTHLFVSVKNHLQVYDLSNGNVVGSWSDTVDISVPSKKQEKKVASVEELKGDKKLKNNDAKPVAVAKTPVPIQGATPIYNYIRSLNLSKDEKYLVGTTDSDKAAVIFEVDLANSENCLKIIKRQIFPKRPCAVSIGDDSDLIVADKFGDVYATTIDSEPPVDEKALTPILGHVSMLSDVKFTRFNGKKFILTGDRDEHIRITNYPKAYVVKNWLFGHHEFVSTLHIPSYDPSLLISGGGDDYLCLWKWYDNKLLAKIELRDLIAPYLTEAHMPAERFLKPDSVKEISITKILTHSVDDKKILLVLCENTNCILTFEIAGDFSVKHLQTFVTKDSIIDICLEETSGRVFASIDREEGDLVELYDLGPDGQLSVASTNMGTKITEGNHCQVESRQNFYPLYYINTLRKRSEH